MQKDYEENVRQQPEINGKSKIIVQEPLYLRSSKLIYQKE